VISSGDLVTFGNRGKLWEIYAARHVELRTRTLYLAAPGNHELTSDSTARANWAAVMGPPAADQRLWYALDIPEVGARFVFLDSNSLRDWHPGAAASLAEDQLAWADSVLATGPPRRFVVLHHGLLSGGHYRHPWDSNQPGSVIAKRRDRLLEMCAARHVTAMFAGHEHMYQRVYVETADGGFWHITTAGGGSPLYPFDPPIRDLELSKPLPPGMHVVTASVSTRSVYHFCRLVLPRQAERAPTLEVMRVGVGGDATEMDRIELGRFTPGAAAGANDATGSH
jgi:hypothetical protein